MVLTFTPQQLKSREKKFIEDSTRWPRWPLLPLKRRLDSGVMDFGFLVADGKGLIVYKGSIFALDDSADLNHAEHFQYDNVDSLLAAGWRVD